jgi:predicted RNA-binding protein with PIN domain
MELTVAKRNLITKMTEYGSLQNSNITASFINVALNLLDKRF